MKWTLVGILMGVCLSICDAPIQLCSTI